MKKNNIDLAVSFIVHIEQIPILKKVFAILCYLAAFLPLVAHATQPIHYGLFGDVHVGVPSAVQRTAIFVSDRNGWDARAESIAQALSANGTLVFGVDLPEYLKHMLELKDKCAYPAGHFEGMSDWMQHHQELKNFIYPIMIGDGAGASFAYAVSVQAPAGTFTGLVTLGFDMSFRLSKSLCAGDAGALTAAAGGGYRVIPVAQLPCEWLPLPFAVNARTDGLLNYLNRLIHQLSPILLFKDKLDPGAELNEHLLRWRRHRYETEQLPAEVADLPLVEQMHSGEFAKRIAVILTGDGGWAGLDIAIANQLAKRGIDVVGLNSLKFFWHTRTPEEATDALNRIVSHYGALHPDADFIVIGYSFGAALAPVVINRAKQDIRDRISAQVLISPDAEAVFEIKVGDWLGSAHHDNTLPAVPELTATTVPAICVHGNEEKEPSICSKVEKTTIKILELPGGHHYNGDYDGLAEAIFKALPQSGK